ncbi:MAG: nucleotidyltransferase family protein [Solirubrobacterales bacterium]
MSGVALRPLRDLVEAHRDEIKAIVARHHGRSVAIFGSVARGDERPDSDIDFLVELEPEARPIEILSIGVELEEALGVKVDVGTPASLRERLRDEVLAEAVPLCAGRTMLGWATSSRLSTRSGII